MLQYPFVKMLQSMQPVVVLDDQLWCVSRSIDARVRLCTAAGVSHGIVPISTLRAAWLKSLAMVLPAIEAIVLAQLPRRVAESCKDPIAYFGEFLAPAFARRDFSEQLFTSENQAGQSMPADVSAAVKSALREAPAPRLNTPTISLFGRVWSLAPRPQSRGCWQILLEGGECLGLSGDFALVATLAREWNQQVNQFVDAVTKRLAEKLALEQMCPACVAIADLEKHGCLVAGDLLFLPGNPPRLGHVIPPHRNTALALSVAGDLAITVPLVVPPRPVPDRQALAVYRRSSIAWAPVKLPNGLCLGPGPESHPNESPGLALAAYLRWAAIRIATNGRFHEKDRR